MEQKQGTLESCPCHCWPAGTHQPYQICSTHSSSGTSSKQGARVILKQVEPCLWSRSGLHLGNCYYLCPEQSFSLPRTILSAGPPYLHDCPRAQRDSQHFWAWPRLPRSLPVQVSPSIVLGWQHQARLEERNLKGTGPHEGGPHLDSQLQWLTACIHLL